MSDDLTATLSLQAAAELHRRTRVQELQTAEWQSDFAEWQSSPQAKFPPELMKDENGWYAAWGLAPYRIIGTGPTPWEAMEAYDEAWHSEKGTFGMPEDD